MPRTKAPPSTQSTQQVAQMSKEITMLRYSQINLKERLEIMKHENECMRSKLHAEKNMSVDNNASQINWTEYFDLEGGYRQGSSSSTPWETCTTDKIHDPVRGYRPATSLCESADEDSETDESAATSDRSSSPELETIEPDSDRSTGPTKGTGKGRKTSGSLIERDGPA